MQIDLFELQVGEAIWVARWVIPGHDTQRRLCRVVRVTEKLIIAEDTLDGEVRKFRKESGVQLPRTKGWWIDDLVGGTK